MFAWLEAAIQKRKARRAQAKLPRAYRDHAIQLASDCCSACADESTVESFVRSRVGLIDESVPGVSFGIAEIAALIELCVAIYRFMKAMGWLEKASPLRVAMTLEGN